ncbi:hypothetical protein [Parafrankia sp. FMc2]|uniref:hypothetical protein n=1 Tax=Parafrankia sp. FMc2 TaxID=3233196 RepID=UPI0034D4B5F8
MTLPSPGRCTATCSGRQRPDLAGKPCRNPPVRGGTVCRMHGGSAPTVKAKAAERTADAGLRGVLAGYDITPVGDPFNELLTLAGEILGMKDLARDLVADLNATDGPDAHLAVYERALDRSGKILGDIARLKIDSRLASISEQQANTLVQVITAVVRRLGLDIDDLQVRAAVRTELAAVQA